MLEPRPFTHDDAMLDDAAADGRPRLRVYALDETAVVIGRGGKLDVEVHAERVAADGASLYRRRGGGCAVVLDPGNLVAALALPLPGISGITTAFGAISDVMAEALDACGVPGVVQRGVSDLAVDDRKLGGSCVHRMRGMMYYSTTLLLDPAWPLMDRYLPHPPREPDYRRGRPHRQFLTSLRELGAMDTRRAWLARLQEALAPRVGPLQDKLLKLNT